jgi:hypothetical protein
MEKMLVAINDAGCDCLSVGINSFSVAIAGFPNLILSSDCHDVIARPRNCGRCWSIWILGIDLSIKDCMIGSHLKLLYLTLLED